MIRSETEYVPLREWIMDSKLRVKLHVYSMRLSFMPPLERYLWLATVLLGVVVYCWAMFLLFTDGKDGQFGHHWGPSFIVIGLGICMVAVIWRAFRKDTTTQAVNRETKRIDQHYEELCDRYWREP